MANITVTDNDLNSPILADADFRDELITFAGADTLAPGTILARDSVSLKLVIFVKGGATNENGIPKAVLTYEVVAAGAGDVPVRAGIAGKYRKEKLVIDADGDDSNIDAAVIDELRAYGLTPIDVTELNIADNQ
ncbi:head decoration protein [bacterium]|nr:head decoration protein [bacterium]